MPKPEPIVLLFEKAKETKNKHVFSEAENGPDGKPVKRPDDKPIVGMLYVQKKALKNIGNPEVLHVRIEAP